VMTPFQQQQSAYQYVPAAAAGSEAAAGSKKAKKFIRVGGGSVWQDATLAEWPEDDFRLFVGDIGNEVSDAELAAAFAGYASFQRAKIVRDKFTSKSKGFGFVSFLDGFDMMKALREQQGKYLGNRPMKLSKSTWQDRNIQQVRKKERKNKKDKKALGLL
jgi:RNA recognition motif-containing protein